MKRIISVFVCIAVLFSLSACGEKQPAGKEEQKNLYEADSGKISVVSLEAVDGLFVEKGGQDEVKSTAAIVVKNNSDKILEYGTISFRVNDYERAEFVISALPAGEKCLVMETTARVLHKEDKYTVLPGSCTFSYCDASTESGKYKLEIEGSTLKLTNKTEAPLTAKIAYKYYKNDMYYGGIAFRGTFENIEAGKTMEKTSERFSADCRIVNITTY